MSVPVSSHEDPGRVQKDPQKDTLNEHDHNSVIPSSGSSINGNKLCSDPSKRFENEDQIPLLEPASELTCRLNLVSFHERSLWQTLTDLREKCEILEHSKAVGECAQSVFAECALRKMIMPEDWSPSHTSLPCWKAACVLLAGYACFQNRETCEVCQLFGTKARKDTTRYLRFIRETIPSLKKVKQYNSKYVHQRSTDEYSKDVLARWSRYAEMSINERRITEKVLGLVNAVFAHRSTMVSTNVAVSLYIVLKKTRGRIPPVRFVIQEISGVAAPTIVTEASEVMRHSSLLGLRAAIDEAIETEPNNNPSTS